MKKKEYNSPEFSLIRIQLQNTVLTSGPEYLSSQVTGGDDWGDDEGEIIN